MANLEKLLSEASPAPWTVDPDNREGMEWNRHVIDYDFNRVCFMAHNGGARPKNDEANASLIAMAPDLAAALIEAEKALAVEHAYWDKIAQSDLQLQEVAYDYPMPLKMTEAMRKADALSAALDRIRKITGGE